MRLQEQGKTEQARKDLGNWLLSVHYFSFQSTELMFSVTQPYYLHFACHMLRRKVLVVWDGAINYLIILFDIFLICLYTSLVVLVVNHMWSTPFAIVKVEISLQYVLKMGNNELFGNTG